MAYSSSTGGSGGGRAAEAASTAKEQAGDVAGHAKEQAGNVAGHAQEQAGAVAGHAKEQASAVAGHAQEQAGAVVGSVKEQAGEVVAEARTQAMDLLGELRRQVDEQSETQRGRLAAFLRSTGDELAQMGRSSEGSGVATNLVRQAGQRATSWGSSLESSSTTDLLDQVRSFARRKPGTFLLGALAAGLLAGRATRGVSAASSHTSDSPAGTGRQLEPLSTAPTPTYGTAGLPPVGVGTGVAAHGTDFGVGQHAQRGVDRDVDLYGENTQEDLLPHHLRSDVPSVSDAPAHGSRP
ncbi:hypothetical protein GTQ99_17105 [Kineococcus sp. T13]|uniref:ATP synthase F0 subunit B n=1 Tax=Kineococcus vitellinus TaxID=2696565 RepID=UPI00141368E0|nr:ATP synthase F0 subunit B [Kineococcus vitellinus]NAZ77126.1 hypothetical protein [Kineococcus vitellinus]